MTLKEKECFANCSAGIGDAPDKAVRDQLVKALVTEPAGSARR